MYTMKPDFKAILAQYLPKPEKYPFNEFTMDVDPEDVKKDIEQLRLLDKLVKESLKIPDDVWHQRITI